MSLTRDSATGPVTRICSEAIISRQWGRWKSWQITAFSPLGASFVRVHPLHLLLPQSISRLIIISSRRGTPLAHSETRARPYKKTRIK